MTQGLFFLRKGRLFEGEGVEFKTLQKLRNSPSSDRNRGNE